MIEEEKLLRVIEYLDEHIDSEADEEVRWALRWVLNGKVREMNTPGIIQTALGEIEEEGADAEEPYPPTKPPKIRTCIRCYHEIHNGFCVQNIANQGNEECGCDRDCYSDLVEDLDG